MKKLAIISSHPIQYNAPLFVLLAKQPNIELKVFYTWGEESLGAKFDPDFGKEIEWDIPLLDGYSFKFVKNISKNPGTHHFKGIINPSLNQEIEDWKPDAVWIWGWSFHSHLKAMRYFKGKVQVWFRGDSTLLDEPKRFSFKKMARRIFLKWVYKHIDKAFYVGTHNKAYFIKHGLQDSQLVYSPHAIDNDRFRDIDGKYDAEAKKWRKSLGIQGYKKILLFIGKFESKKNPLFFSAIISQLTENNIISC
jgi:glycosyltransferase involved in cell wall biosynthesis